MTQRGGCSLSVTVLVTAKVADVDAVVHVQDARGASAACTALNHAGHRHDKSRPLGQHAPQFSLRRKVLLAEACLHRTPLGLSHLAVLLVLVAADIQVPEVRAFYGFQIAMENIHSEMYSLLLETYVQDGKERHNLLNAINNIPVIQKKAAWAMK